MRHAQRHWLETQARAAVELAMMAPTPSPLDEGTAYFVIAAERHRALKRAASQLVKAEMLHRRLVMMSKPVERICPKCGDPLESGEGGTYCYPCAAALIERDPESLSDEEVREALIHEGIDPDALADRTREKLAEIRAGYRQKAVGE